jgi:hypothetical protein
MARAKKGTRVRARADKGQGYNGNNREGGKLEAASFNYFYCNIVQSGASSLPFKCDASSIDTCSVVLLYLERLAFPVMFLCRKGKIARNNVANKHPFLINLATSNRRSNILPTCFRHYQLKWTGGIGV